MADYEFLRDCYALVPDSGVDATAVYARGRQMKQGKARAFCSCRKGERQMSCVHRDTIIDSVNTAIRALGGLSPSDHFLQSTLYNVFAPAIRLAVPPAASVKITRGEEGLTLSGGNAALATAQGEQPFLDALSSRLGDNTAGGVNRASLLERCRGFALTEAERALAERGHKSGRQAEEDSLWFRLAYHCYRASEINAIPAMKASIGDERGELTVSLTGPQWRVCVEIPRTAAFETINRLWGIGPEVCDFAVDRTEREISFSICTRDLSSIKITAGLRGIDAANQDSLFPVLDQMLHGNLAYIPDLRTLFRLTPGSLGACALHLHRVPAGTAAEVAELLARNASAFSLPSAGGVAGQLDLFSQGDPEMLDRIVSPRLVRSFDSLELEPVSMDEKECEVRVRYRAGSVAVGLDELQNARNAGLPYLVMQDAIVDMEAELVDTMPPLGGEGGGEGIVRMNKTDLARIAVCGISVCVKGDNRFSSRLAGLLEVKPVEPLRRLDGLRADLRAYQARGLEWLLFLYDNGFGGLLCDEMGLGKTHQAMGLLCAIREQRDPGASSLVVCPTTVLSHWVRLIGTFAESIPCLVYHGPDRALPSAGSGEVVLTTYGVMRNDAEALGSFPFAVAIFDEAQHMKNRGTGLWQVAQAVKARAKIALTGSPIENSLSDLKSLFDLVLPGYLGTDTAFVDRFIGPIESHRDRRATSRLHRLISPFLLRRMKRDVLAELPEKIEDSYTCGLSDEQRALYGKVLRGEGASLVSALVNSVRAVPYMHIFAVIEKLKQICDHPAVFHKCPDAFDLHNSEKFDLFIELLGEAVDSGEKVVVFSQSLPMIEIIRRHLDTRSIGRVVLTGSSRNRGELLRRFQSDPSIRVFIGSLKAGGTGIDLTAASVVIHYDRWWNAAREDQATDRVHRIGQTKGVQVIRLVTKGTVEERIDAIIGRKRKLAQESLTTDAPEELKLFTREELLEILSDASRY